MRPGFRGLRGLVPIPLRGLVPIPLRGLVPIPPEIGAIGGRLLKVFPDPGLVGISDILVSFPAKSDLAGKGRHSPARRGLRVWFPARGLTAVRVADPRRWDRAIAPAVPMARP